MNKKKCLLTFVCMNDSALRKTIWLGKNLDTRLKYYLQWLRVSLVFSVQLRPKLNKNLKQLLSKGIKQRIKFDITTCLEDKNIKKQVGQTPESNSIKFDIQNL